MPVFYFDNHTQFLRPFNHVNSSSSCPTIMAGAAICGTVDEFLRIVLAS